MEQVHIDCGSCSACKGRGFLRSQDYYDAMKLLIEGVQTGTIPESEFPQRSAALAQTANTICLTCNGHGTGSGGPKERVVPLTPDEIAELKTVKTQLTKAAQATEAEAAKQVDALQKAIDAGDVKTTLTLVAQGVRIAV